MEFETQEHDRPTAGSTPENSHALNGVWNKPSSTIDAATAGLIETTSGTPLASNTFTQTRNDGITSALANETNAPIFTDSDGQPVGEDKLGSLKFNGLDNQRTEVAMLLPKLSAGERRDVSTVSDRRRAADKTPTVEALARVAHNAIGSDQFGNKVPSTAAEYRNETIPKNLKCASTSSQWLVDIGAMTNRDFKIRVDDLMKILPAKGFDKVPLRGNLDISKFPDGPIGFITGQDKYEDDSNHIGFIEKRNGELHVIHNNYKTGKVVDQEIKEKFYNADGTPAYRQMNLFVFKK
ncbi:MAG: hypothetical protein SGJ27_08130 [Candidatus Melainabacteria bacterium]|nr:hypothetical protein [Candidatus Melainabacteria bacterium]